MCGVFGMALNRPLRPPDVALGRAGAAMLAHRGPDGAGEWRDDAAGVFLGHRRLAVIDLSDASSQPMAKAGLTVAYNGELYNFRDLRDVLQDGGARIATSGDVEVLLEAWRAWGEGALARFDGMFAFALWDGRAVHLAVDPFGEKPLFVAETADGAYFSSELAPLARLLGLRPRFTERQLCAYLALGAMRAPETPYAEVRRLPPATVASLRGGRLGAFRRYWTPPAPEPGRGPVAPVPEAGLDAIARSLCESLAGRLIADARLGLFLSAGVDSALVAALATRELGVRLECATVSFPRGRVADEAPQAAAIARHLGLPHMTLESEEGPETAGLDALLDLMQQPHDNVSALSVRQLSRAMGREFKAALTGMGGDETTSGYVKHAELYRTRRRYAVAAPFAFLGPALGRVANGRLDRWRAQYLARGWERYLAVKVYPAIDWLRGLPGYEDWARETFDADAPAWLATPRYELAEAMANEQLIAYDHASMRESLELRTPFLSRRVVETVAELDPRALLAFGQKSVLRRLLARYLPRELFDRPKTGFRFPMEIFLRGCGEAPPDLPPLSPAFVGEAWSRRYRGQGWERIAVRLASAAAFMQRASQDAEVGGFSQDGGMEQAWRRVS